MHWSFREEVPFKLDLERGAFPKSEMREGTAVSEGTHLKTRRDCTVVWRELCWPLPHTGLGGVQRRLHRGLVDCSGIRVLSLV